MGISWHFLTRPFWGIDDSEGSASQETADESPGDTFTPTVPAAPSVPAVNSNANKQSSPSQAAVAANSSIGQQFVGSSAIPPGSDGEITFISGITSSATV